MCLQSLEKNGKPASPDDITGCDCSKHSACYKSGDCFDYKKTIVLKQTVCKPGMGALAFVLWCAYDPISCLIVGLVFSCLQWIYCLTMYMRT